MAVNMNGNNNGNNSKSYEALYTELLDRGEQLHESNKRRIRRGIIILIILPVILEIIRWITDSDKVVFLIVWIIIMFVVSAYLISIEYLDSSVEKTLRDVTDTEAEFDGLLPRPELPGTDLQEIIRDRIDRLRADRGAETKPEEETETDPHDEAAPDAEDDTELFQEALEHLTELEEAEEAMEELRETAPAGIITAMKEAFDSGIIRTEDSKNKIQDADSKEGDA